MPQYYEEPVRYNYQCNILLHRKLFCIQVLINPYCNALVINAEIYVYASLKHSKFSFPVDKIYICIHLVNSLGHKESRQLRE